MIAEDGWGKKCEQHILKQLWGEEKKIPTCKICNEHQVSTEHNLINLMCIADKKGTLFDKLFTDS